jgi:outer membrane protein
MSKNIQCFAVAACVAGLFASGAASAQTAGSLLLRGGVARITPQVDSGALSAPSFPNTRADVDASTQLGGGITYMVDDHLAVDFPLSLPFKHDINGDGAIAGVGKIGETKALPVTLLAQYRFLEASSPFRPYVGGGLTYAKFFKEKGTAALTALTGGSAANPTTLKIDSKFAATLQVGATYAFNERWFVDGTILKTFLKTRTTLSSGQSMDITLDPLTTALFVGYRF